MPRRERLFLEDIVHVADELSAIINGATRDAIAADDVLRSAALLKLLFIGEAASHVSDDTRKRYPGVPWQKIVAFRNLAIHTYFGIDWNIVCGAAFDDAPLLRVEVAALIAAEFDEPESG